MHVNVRRRFWMAVGFQCLILLGVVGMKQHTVWTGQTIRLQTTPVDPRSLFRGDYVSLRYPISDLADELFAGGTNKIERGDVVYVVLAGGDAKWRATSVHPRMPELDPGEVVLRGEFRQSWLPGSGTVPVEYGIESYFVPEGTGWKIERASGSRLTVEVAIDRGGRAVVRRLFVDGVPFDPAGDPEPARGYP